MEDFSGKSIHVFCDKSRADSDLDTGLERPTEQGGISQLVSGAVRRMQRPEALESITVVLQVPLDFCTRNGESSALD